MIRMETKFKECVFIENDRDTFLEYASLKELLDEHGEEYKKNIIGYFPVETNVTYKELEEIKEEKSWTIAYHKGGDDSSYSYQILVSIHSTLELKRRLKSIIEDAYHGKECVIIYKNEDIVYV